MPTVYGRTYPEVDSAGLLNHTLKVFFHFSDLVDKLPHQGYEICTLRAYLEGIPNSPVSVHVYTDIRFAESADLGFISISKIPKDKEITKAIREVVDKFDFDIVATDDKSLVEALSKEKNIDFTITSFDDAKKWCEVFSRGHEIPWSFSDPVWNMPWETFYTMSDDFAKKTAAHYGDIQRTKVDADTMEMIRSLLLNRTAQICYTRDKLLFLILQKKYARRHKWERQSFNFESTYYLSYYYFTLWGGIDQLSRIVANILEIRCKDDKGKIGRSIANDRFVKKIQEKSEVLGDVYQEENFKDWIQQLKRNRHFVAHEGCAMLSSIVQEPNGGILEEELEREVVTNPDFVTLRLFLGDELVGPLKELFKQNLKFSKYKVMQDEIMVVADKKSGEKYIFKPLLNVEWDFNNYELILYKTLEVLYKIITDKTKPSGISS